MNTGFRLGSIADVDILIDWSLFSVFFLVTFGLGAGVFPAWHPDWGAALIWTTALAAAISFFLSVLLHELSHALVGRAQGIEIRRITLFVLGGMAQLERKPSSWRGELLMAIVGPITSFVVGVLCIVVARLSAGEIQLDANDPMQAYAMLGPLATVMLWVGPINILLGAFNLIPGFPLDGGRVMSISTLIDNYIMRTDQRAFPVVEDGRLLGIVCLEDARRVDPSARAMHTVRTVMTPVHDLTTATPEEASVDALRALSQRGVNQLPVVKDGAVRELIRREDILKWLSLYGEHAAAT